MNPAPRFIAGLPIYGSVAEFIEVGRLIISMTTGNVNVPTPTPSLPQLTARFDALETSQGEFGKGAAGAIQQRDIDLRAAQRDMRLFVAFVQREADAHLDEAEKFIVSTGLRAWMRTKPKKDSTSVKHAKTPHTVVLYAKALPRPVLYRWQMSTNQQDWTDLSETFSSTTTVEGLTPATIYYFRLRTLTQSGLSDWSPTISIIAH